MLCVGSSNIQLHLLEQESSFGKRVTQLMPPRNVQLKPSCKSLTDTPRFMRNSSLFQLLKERNQTMRDSLELTSQQLLKFMSQLVEEVFKVPPPINLVKTLLRCLRSTSRIKTVRGSKLGKRLGVSVPDLSEP